MWSNSLKHYANYFYDTFQMLCVFMCRIFYVDLNCQDMKHHKHGMVGKKCNINSFPANVSPIEKSRVYPWTLYKKAS
jgi:hypothetical protein